MTRSKLMLGTSLALLVALGGIVSAQAPSSGHSSESAVWRFADFSTVAGGYSRLYRGTTLIAMELATTDLVPDAPYTTWWVIFNRPEGCFQACDLDDLFNPDGTMNLNPAANISVLFADGVMTDAAGNASFSAILPVRRTLGEVIAGPGLIDPRKAEVHIVVRAHGPLDLSRAYIQLSTFEPHPIVGGTCTECEDVQFAVHLPVTARANER